MGEVRRGEVIALPARFGDASEDSGGLTEGSEGLAPVVELLEFRSLERGAGRYSARVAAVAETPEPASRWTEEIAALEARLRAQEESARAQVERARRDGQMEGQKAAEQETERRVMGARTEVEQIAERFRLEHEQYFRRVEREVVRLALAIAARVLHREAAMDPLLLAGAVRVALEKLADTSGLVLRTAPGEVLAWQEMFRLTGEARVRPEVIGDLGLKPGDCVLETRLGTVELGVRAQLEEIEKGFFDLLNQKPKRVGVGR